MALFLVRNKIVRANSRIDARRIAEHPDWPVCGILQLDSDGVNSVIIDLDSCKMADDMSGGGPNRQYDLSDYPNNFLTED